MGTAIVFETATIADSIKKAARIAPAKAGHAFDKASGIVFDIYPGEDASCVLRSTNLNAFYAEVVASVSTDGSATRWRLPAQLLAGVVGTLPIGSGKQVKFEQEGSKVKITSGRMKATMMLADPDYYPNWEMFDGTSMTMVSGLGGRIAQVEWAASPHNDPPLSGVYLDGEWAIATDRYRLARVPCRIALPRPIVIPSGVLGQALRQMGDTGVAVGGHMLYLAPDDYTQLQTVIYDVEYPAIEKVMRTDHPATLTLRKQAVLDVLNRANNFAGADRTPLLRIYVGKGEFAPFMQNDEVGLLGDVLDCPGEADHKRIEIRFTPKNLIDAISNAPNDNISFGYDPELPNRPIYLNGGSGYEAWVVPRQDKRPEVE